MKTREAVEMARLEWAGWFYHLRLLEPLAILLAETDTYSFPDTSFSQRPWGPDINQTTTTTPTRGGSSQQLGLFLRPSASTSPADVRCHVFFYHLTLKSIA
jgi:hypothetical protein